MNTARDMAASQLAPPAAGRLGGASRRRLALVCTRAAQQGTLILSPAGGNRVASGDDAQSAGSAA